MATITQIVNSLTTLEQELPEIVAESVVETKEDYLNQQAAQAAAGLTRDQEPITLDGGGYSPSTIRYKKDFGKGLGSVTDRVTMYNTGRSYETMELTVSGEDVNVNFTTPQAKELKDRTGERAFGIGGEYRSEYLIPLKEAIIEKIEAKTKLKFG